MTTAAAVAVNVLNTTYQPLGVTRLKRAMALVLRGDAVIEEADPEREIRHANGTFPWPLVIRLLKYVKLPVRYDDAIWSKAGVLRRDGYRCAYNTKHDATTVDHILPVSRGGKNTWDNTVAACQPCNAKKDNKTPKEAGMALLIKPHTPQRLYLSSTKK